VGSPPTCEISSPTDESTFEFGDSVVVHADVSDPDDDVAHVTFKVNGKPKAVEGSPPYTYVLSNVAYSIGVHSIAAVATDEAGLEDADTITVSITSESTPAYGYEIVATYPHDADAFTQGLLYEDGYLYEGTGIYGESSLRKVDLETGDVLMRRDLSGSYFGEGITTWGDRIYQLTWQSRVGFVYAKDTFDSLRAFSYDTEGWGLTNDDSELIMSDGSSTISFRNAETFDINRQITVADGTTAVTWLNELEYVDGSIFANVWYHDRIARIHPEDGRVIGWIDLGEICDVQPNGVLNGIAYDDGGDRLLVTGKNWDLIYEIRLTF
jgi:glutamine cyclotransferase